jgi:hypothetical protein
VNLALMAAWKNRLQKPSIWVWDGVGMPSNGIFYLENDDLVGGFKHFFIFHFIYGMSSFPLTDIFSRWLKPPTSKPIDSIDRISVKDFRFSIALTRCKRSYP